MNVPHDISAVAEGQWIILVIYEKLILPQVFSFNDNNHNNSNNNNIISNVFIVVLKHLKIWIFFELQELEYHEPFRN